MIRATLLVTAILTLSAPTAAATQCARTLGDLAFGANFTHVGIDRTNERACRPDLKAALITPDRNVLMQYDRPQRSGVAREILTRMHSTGARTLRVMVWFSPEGKSDYGGPQGRGGPEARSDRIGTLRVADRQLPDAYVRNLTAFVNDAARSGFSKITIALGPQGRASPTCKRNKRQDCFDPDTTALSWGVARQLAQAVRAPAGMTVAFDLGNELCPSARGDTDFDRNSRRYLSYIIPRFQQNFPGVPFTVSCAASSPRQMLWRLRGLEEAYRSTGAHPASVNVQVYSSPAETAAIVKTAHEFADRFGTPLVVSEMPADSDTIDELVARKVAGQLPRLAELVAWPKRRRSECSVELEPEDTVANLAQSLCQ